MRVGKSIRVLLCFGLAFQFSAQGQRIEMNDESFVIGNPLIQRTVLLRPHLRTVSLKNISTGHEFQMESDEFLIVLDNGNLALTSRDFTLTEAPSSLGNQVRCALNNAPHGIKVEVFYEIKNESDFWTRKWLEIDAGAHLINFIEVERFRFLSPTPELKRFDKDPMPFPGKPWDITVGRPIYAGREIFLGLEHPAGRNEFDEMGMVTLRHYPGKRGPLRSWSAVIGVAPDQPCARLNDKFLEYIDRIRVRPVKRHVQWIAYFHVGVSDELAIEKMQYAKRTFADRGVRLDCVLMDSGWTEGKSIMRISKVRPNRPSQIKKLAQEYLGTGLGLHVITSGVKPMVDKDWLAEQCYDLIFHKNAREGAYCLADPRVQKEFESNLVKYVKDYDIVAYKFDWGYFACDRPNHRGHLPGLEYGLEANCDTFIKTLQALRAAKPEIFLFNTGWYSPWWLMYYDAVFSSGADYNFSLISCPAFATCTAKGTWRDAVVRGNLVQWAPFFPLNSLMHHSPTNHWWQDWNARYKDPLDQFANHIIMSYFRGSQMTEIGLNIAALTEEHRDILASIMNWAARHDDILLASVRYIGGEPLKGEVYGYTHFAKDGRGLIALKNPNAYPQRFELKFGEECGLAPTTERYALNIIYPYRSGLDLRPGWGESVAFELQPHEVLVIEALPGKIPLPPRKVAGKPITIQDARIKPVENEIQGIFKVNVPPEVNASLVLLAERPKLLAAVLINGKSVELEAPHIQVEDSKEPARTYDGKVYGQRGEMGLSIKGPWSLFRTPLPVGASEVKFAIPVPSLDAIPVSPAMKPGPLPSPRRATIPLRCMIHTTQDLAPPPSTKNLSELPARWVNVLRQSIDLLPPAPVELVSTRRFEIYKPRPGEKLFTDSDARIVSFPSELAGCNGIRFPKSQAAQNASLTLTLPRPGRVVVAFGKEPGYLSAPEGWARSRPDCFECTDPTLGRELHWCELPKGEVTLFPGMAGAYAVLALVEQPQNLALKRPVMAQSTHTSGHAPHYATDGDVRTQWWSTNGLPQWVQVDLGEVRNINCVRIIFYHDDVRSYQYKVETSTDGTTWQLAHEATKNTALSTAAGYRHAFTPRPARFVRVTVTGGRGRVKAAHICELEVFDDKLATLETPQ